MEEKAEDELALSQLEAELDAEFELEEAGLGSGGGGGGGDDLLDEEAWMDAELSAELEGEGVG